MPTGLFDDLVETEEPQSTNGLFDDLVDRDEGTTYTGKYYPPEERKGVTYQGQYIPSMYEIENGRETRIRESIPKGAFERFREGATHGFMGGLEGVNVLTAPDDDLKNMLVAEMEKMKVSSTEPEPSLIEKGSEMAGNLAGAGAGAIISQVGLNRAGMAGFFGASSARDSFLHAGLRAMAEGKTPEEATQIAKRVSRTGAVIGAVEGAVLPAGGAGTVKQVAKQAGIGGTIGGAGQVARNVSERVAGLKTPILENVPQAVGMMAGVPVLFGGAGGVYRALTRKGAPIPPAPVPEPTPVPVQPFAPPAAVKASPALLRQLSPASRALLKNRPATTPPPQPLIEPIVAEGVPRLPRGEPSGLAVAERPTQPRPSGGEIRATSELLDLLPPGKLTEIPVSEFLRAPAERGPALGAVEELGQGARFQKDFEQQMRRREEMGNQLRGREDAAEQARLEKRLEEHRVRQDELTKEIRKRIDFEKARAETVSQKYEAIVHPDKPLTENQVRIVQDSLKKAILENQIPGERPGFISGTALEKWADNVLSSDLRGRMSINPVDILTKDIAALAIKGAAVIERGVRDYPAWSAEMTKLYGDEFKPILRKVYMQSLQVKGAATPNALQRETTSTIQPLRQEPQASQGQVPVQARLPEAVIRSEPVVQQREVGKAQVPLNIQKVLDQPIKQIAAEWENIPTDEIVSHYGGFTQFAYDVGSRAKTKEDVAVLREMAESSKAKALQLMRAGDFDGASKIASRQPAEAYEYATGVMLDGTPKWDTIEKLSDPNYRPPVPDAKYLAEKGQPASRGIAASARDALASDVPRGTEAGFVRLPEQFKQAVESFNVNDPAAPLVLIDKAHIVPRLQPWDADKLISSSPEGIGRIPGLGRLFDPRAGAFSQVDRAIITNAKERGVGETVAALWGETNKGSNPFKADADGAIALASGTGRLSDVIEAEMRTPGSQPLTPEQRTWINEVWKPVHKDVTEMLKQEGVKGFDVSEGERGGGGAYFPRIAIGKKDTSSGKSKPGGSSVGGKQFFQKQRQYDSEAQGSDTTIYEPDATKRVASYISRAYRAIADHRLAQDESLGSRALSDGPPLFQKEGLVMQPVFSGKVFPKETADRLNKFYGQSSRDWVQKLGKLNDAAKTFKLSLDWSAPLTQGLPVLFNRPGAWARATKNSFLAMMDPDHLGKALNQPGIKEAASELAQLGVSLSRLQEFMAGSEKGALATRIPVVGPIFEATGRGFGALMDMAKIEMWRSYRAVTPKEKWPAMAEFVENLAGTARMESIGISPSRALLERLLFLAPSYYRMGVSLVATAAQGGVVGSAARMALIRFGMGVALVSVAGMKAAGLAWDEIQERLNPAKGKFLKVPVQVGDKKVEVGFGHLLISLARLVGDTIEEAQSDKPAGSGVEREPWKKWLRNHSAPVPSTLIDLTTGTDAMGKEVGTLKAIGKQFVPISADQALQEGTVGQRAFDASMSFFGMNAYPQSVREMFRNERDAMSKKRFGKEYESLPLGEQATIHIALDQDQRFQTPTVSAKVMKMAFENDVARQTRLLKSLSPEIQKHIEELGLHVTGYEPKIRVITKLEEKVDLPMTLKQAERYEALIAEEYAKVLKTAKWKNWANLKPEVRQDTLNELLLAGKNRAKTKFMNQAGK